MYNANEVTMKHNRTQLKLAAALIALATSCASTTGRSTDGADQEPATTDGAEEPSVASTTPDEGCLDATDAPCTDPSAQADPPTWQPPTDGQLWLDLAVPPMPDLVGAGTVEVYDCRDNMPQLPANPTRVQAVPEGLIIQHMLIRNCVAQVDADLELDGQTVRLTSLVVVDVPAGCNCRTSMSGAICLAPGDYNLEVVNVRNDRRSVRQTQGITVPSP